MKINKDIGAWICFVVLREQLIKARTRTHGYREHIPVCGAMVDRRQQNIPAPFGRRQFDVHSVYQSRITHHGISALRAVDLISDLAGCSVLWELADVQKYGNCVLPHCSGKLLRCLNYRHTTMFLFIVLINYELFKHYK